MTMRFLSWLRFLVSMDFALRFIEFMDVGNSNSWKSERLVSKKEILGHHTRYPLREEERPGKCAVSRLRVC